MSLTYDFDHDRDRGMITITFFEGSMEMEIKMDVTLIEDMHEDIQDGAEDTYKIENMFLEHSNFYIDVSSKRVLIKVLSREGDGTIAYIGAALTIPRAKWNEIIEDIYENINE